MWFHWIFEFHVYCNLVCVDSSSGISSCSWRFSVRFPIYTYLMVYSLPLFSVAMNLIIGCMLVEVPFWSDYWYLHHISRGMHYDVLARKAWIYISDYRINLKVCAILRSSLCEPHPRRLPICPQHILNLYVVCITTNLYSVDLLSTLIVIGS